MSERLDDISWDDLLARISENEVVPIIGPGAVTFGVGDELLYPWLVHRLSTDPDLRLTFQKPPRELHEIIDVQRAKDQPIERIYRRLNKIVEDPDLRPGPTLAALAGI